MADEYGHGFSCFVSYVKLKMEPLDNMSQLLNQVCAGLWLVHAWFLNIASVWTSVCMCVHVCVCPEAINNQWRDMA